MWYCIYRIYIFYIGVCLLIPEWAFVLPASSCCCFCCSSSASCCCCCCCCQVVAQLNIYISRYSISSIYILLSHTSLSFSLSLLLLPFGIFHTIKCKAKQGARKGGQGGSRGRVLRGGVAQREGGRR